MSFFGTTDPRLNRGMGLVPGQTDASFQAVKPSVTSTGFETLWDIVGNFTFPTGGETWEIVSDDANDTIAGTGARTVLISGLDTSYNPQTESKDLNGTTAVVTTRTDWLRITGILVTDSGSSAWNEGTLTLQVSVAGAVRATALPTLARSFNGFFTVPLGKRMFITQGAQLTPKGGDITIRNRIRIFGTSTWFAGGDAPTYQSINTLPFTSYPNFPEKTDIEVTASTSQANIEGFFRTDYTLVDNAQVEAYLASFFSQGF